MLTLLATKRCPFWTPSLSQVTPKLLALLPKLKAVAKDLTGGVMGHVASVLTPAAFGVTQSVCEIAGTGAEVGQDLLDALSAVIGKQGQLAFRVSYALAALRDLARLVGLAEMWLEEAARIQFRKSAWRLKKKRGKKREPVLFLVTSSQFCAWLRAVH